MKVFNDFKVSYGWMTGVTDHYNVTYRSNKMEVGFPFEKRIDLKDFKSEDNIGISSGTLSNYSSLVQLFGQNSRLKIINFFKINIRDNCG